MKHNTVQHMMKISWWNLSNPVEIPEGFVFTCFGSEARRLGFLRYSEKGEWLNRCKKVKTWSAGYLKTGSSWNGAGHQFSICFHRRMEFNLVFFSAGWNSEKKSYNVNGPLKSLCTCKDVQYGTEDLWFFFTPTYLIIKSVHTMSHLWHHRWETAKKKKQFWLFDSSQGMVVFFSLVSGLHGRLEIPCFSQKNKNKKNPLEM